MDQLLLLGSGLLGGLIQKHVFKWLPNKFIPYINVVGSMVAGHYMPGVGAEQGAFIGLASVGTHQAVKIPAKAATGKSI
jgi:hypothetical protein